MLASVITISPPASRSAGRRCTGPSAALWKAIWKPRSAKSSGSARRASSPAKKKPCWWRPPAPTRPRARRDGQAYRARGTVTRDGAPALGREPPEALAQGHVVHPQDRRHLRRPHGGCARPVRRAPRSKAAGGVLRREPDPADRRGATADPRRAGPAGTL